MILIFTAAISAPALDLSLRPRGFVFIPGGAGNAAPDGSERYAVGGGADLGFEVDLASIWSNPLGLGYTAGLEGGLLFDTLKSPAEGSLQLYRFGGALGLYYFPLSRLLTRLDAGMGVYQGISDEGKGKSGLWWRLGGEAGFRFTPSFTLAADLGWQQYQNPGTGGGAFMSGLYAGLTAHITLELGEKSGGSGVTAAFAQDSGLYPALLSLYQHNAAGSITIRNNENAEIRDVRVYFRAGRYTSSEFECGTVARINKGRSAELPLYADFSPELLGFTDSGRVLGEIVIRYTFLGKEKQSVRTITAAVHNRNTIPVSDPAALAAFASYNAPEILEYAKYIMGLARNKQRSGHNQNMQFAIWLFEGLRGLGIREDTPSGESASPASELQTIAEVQFPAQTLAYKSGTVRDLGLLYASALEAAGIPSAFIPLEDDFIIALGLNIDEAAAETLIYDEKKRLAADGELWLPVSMRSLNSGFIAAWEQGAENLNKYFESGQTADLIVLETAWAVYPAAPLPAIGVRSSRIDPAVLSANADAAVNSYVASHIEPLIRSIQTQIQAGASARLYNRLGMLQARAGRMTEARAAYERAAGLGLVPAMTNRGNLALIEKDYAAAERWFKQALAVQPENAAALRGLERVQEGRQ